MINPPELPRNDKGEMMHTFQAQVWRLH